MKNKENMLNKLSNKISNNKKLNKKENEIVETIIEILIFSIDEFDENSIDENKKLITDKINYINSLSEIECSEYIQRITDNYFKHINK